MAKHSKDSGIYASAKHAKSAVTSFLRRLASSHTYKLPRSVPDELQSRAIRLRAEFAETMLRSPQYQESIQMLNEQTVQELLGAKDQASRERLVIRLEVISDFQWLLNAHIDEYEATKLMVEERDRRDREAAGAA